MIEISKREQFYQQEYCGCVYSLRDTNLHRKSGDALLSKLVNSTTVKKKGRNDFYITSTECHNVSIYGMPTVIFESS